MPTILSSVEISHGSAADWMRCIVPTAKLPAYAQVANSYTNVLGPSPGLIWLLMLRGDLDLLVASPPPYSVRFANYSEGGGIVDSITIKTAYLDFSQRIYPGARNDPKALHLVKLWDGKLIPERFSATVDDQYNVPAWAVDPNDGTYQEFLEDAPNAVAQTVLNFVWNYFGSQFDGLAPTLESANVLQSPMYKLIGMNAWRAYNHVAYTNGHAVRYNHEANSVSLIYLGQAQTPANGKPGDLLGRHVKRTSDSVSHVMSQVPTAFRCYFNKHYMSFGQERDTERRDNHSANQVYTTNKTSATDAALLRPSTFMPIWMPHPARYDEDNSQIAGSLNTNATRAAQNLERALLIGGARNRDEYTGIHSDIFPGSEFKVVMYRNLGPALGGSSTTIAAHPGLVDSIRESSFGGYGPRDIDPYGMPDFAWKGAETSAPPDLGRWSYANWPRVCQLVRVDYSSASDIGKLHAPTAGPAAPNLGYWSGSVVRYVAGSLQENLLEAAHNNPEPCWIVNIGLSPGEDGGCGTGAHESHRTPLRQGGYYVARLCGIETIGEDTRPLYVVAEEMNFVYDAQIWSVTGQAFACPSPQVGQITFSDAQYSFDASPAGQDALTFASNIITVHVDALLHITYNVNASRPGVSGTDADDAFKVELLINGARDPLGDSHAHLDDIHAACVAGDPPSEEQRAATYLGTCNLPAYFYKACPGDTIGLQYRRTGGNNTHTVNERFLHVWAAYPERVPVVAGNWPDGGL